MIDCLRYWDKAENDLITKFGDMTDLSDPNNEINAQDISHIQTADILYNHLKDMKKQLKLKDRYHIGYCSDRASNVSSNQQGVAGQVSYCFIVCMFFLPFFLNKSTTFYKHKTNTQKNVHKKVTKRYPILFN